MLETLRSWLNGKRDYFTGVVLFAQLGKNERLLELFKKRQTDYTNVRLQEELLLICNTLKNQDETIVSKSDCGITLADNGGIKQNTSGNVQKQHSTSTISNPNPSLYNACRDKASKVYKEAMNARAILFSLGQNDDYYNPNLPHKVAERSPIAIEVIQKYILASKLYDDASFVLDHGRLPFQEDTENLQDEYASLPDSMVKQALDNLRKNIHKIRKREATPERIELLQKHESNLLKLEERWRLLRP